MAGRVDTASSTMKSAPRATVVRRDTTAGGAPVAPAGPPGTTSDDGIDAAPVRPAAATRPCTGLTIPTPAPGPAAGVTTAPTSAGHPPAPGDKSPRRPEDLFDFVDPGAKPVPSGMPGYLGGIARGTESQPVFGEGKSWFTRELADAGSWVLNELGKSAAATIHQTFENGVDVPLTDDLVLGFTAKGRKVREDSMGPRDARRLGIEELRRKHPGAVPVWIEGNFGEKLSFDLGHRVPLGATGASVRFGLFASEGAGFTMQRLAFLPARGKDLDDAAAQLARLALTPARAASVLAMETGARYEFFGRARFRVDAALGFGKTVPAMSDLLEVGAGIELGAIASLAGEFSLKVDKPAAGRARLRLTAVGGANAGVELEAKVGVTVDTAEVGRLMRGFVDHVAGGGDPATFDRRLPNERERELAASMSGYLRLLAKNLAEGAGRAAVEHLATKYASAYMRAKAGVELGSRFGVDVEFELDSDAIVELPRADMVPPAMRAAAAPGEPLRIRVGPLAQLAYDLAMMGDLRLAQQLSRVRGAGVRVGEVTTTTETGRQSELALALPFVEYRRAASTSEQVTDRFTPELGRTRAALSAFNREYRGLFGRAEDSAAGVRVHTPDGLSDAQVFFGASENLSADLVVQNKADDRTSFAEMQDLLGVLDAISGGRLEKRAREALATGAYRDESWYEKLDPIQQIFCKPAEYGRTVAHLHVWLGETGLRSLLTSDFNDDALYAAIGRVFANLDPKGPGTPALPAWTAPGAARNRPLRPAAMAGDRDGILRFGAGPMDHDLAAARYLVENLKRLRGLVRAARTPAQEEAAAKHVRDFLRDARDKLPAYAALASLVPEGERAVEMRLTALRRGKPPIRFTYIQDGRTSELLHAVGFSRMALRQYERYAAVLDAETRRRTGRLLDEVQHVLNSPSPDLFALATAMRALGVELAHMDELAERMSQRVAEDLGFGRAFLDGLPDVPTIEAALPGPLGAELAALRLNALRQLNAPEPDLVLLRATFTSLLEKMPLYRRIAGASELVEATGVLANELGADHPELARAAVAAVGAWREAVARGAGDAAVAQAEAAIVRAHAQLARAAGEAAGGAGTIVAGAGSREAGGSSPSPDFTAVQPGDLAKSRAGWAERYRTLAGNPALSPISYFERSHVVPPHAAGVPFESGGDGVVTASMIREADLAMAASRQSPILPSPPLAPANVARLAGLARAKDAPGFLAAAEELTFKPAAAPADKHRQALEYFLADLPASARPVILAPLAPERRLRVARIFDELDTRRKVEGRWSATYARDQERFLRLNPARAEDLRFLRQTLATDPASIGAVLDDLGYGRSVDGWFAHESVRLDAALARITGDELSSLAGEMNDAQRGRFYALLAKSDLRPQTRARLAGHVVDDALLLRDDERLVAALVTGMNAADLRIFFDRLHVDGKLEDFLSHRSFWETLLDVLTFGLARLFLHDNAAALRVCAAQGWRADELAVEYGARIAVDALGRRAEEILFNAALDTIPVDPIVRGGMRAVHAVLGDAKYYDLAELPREGRDALAAAAEGAAKQLATRLADVARQGGSPAELAAEYRRFLAGLTPAAVQQQLGTPDVDGSVALIVRALGDGAVAGLIEALSDPQNKLLRLEHLGAIVRATNELDTPIFIRAGTPDPRMDPEDYHGLVDKAAFFKRFIGLDLGKLELLYGGFTSAGVGAVSFADTISMSPARCPRDGQGRITVSDDMQQTLAFHETVHNAQTLVYGVRVSSLVDQAMYVTSGESRDGAYRVDDAMLDAAADVHAFADHWERQASLIEETLRLMWASRERGRPAESYPVGVAVMDVAGGEIHLTPARWEKLVRFVHELGDATRKALDSAGGKVVVAPAHGPP